MVFNQVDIQLKRIEIDHQRPCGIHIHPRIGIKIHVKVRRDIPVDSDLDTGPVAIVFVFTPAEGKIVEVEIIPETIEFTPVGAVGNAIHPGTAATKWIMSVTGNNGLNGSKYQNCK
jgi:hypothetical protein